MILLLGLLLVVALVATKKTPVSTLPYSPLATNVPAEKQYAPDWTQGLGTGPNSGATYYGGQSTGLKPGSW